MNEEVNEVRRTESTEKDEVRRRWQYDEGREEEVVAMEVERKGED